MNVPRPKIFCGKMFMGNNTICKYANLKQNQSSYLIGCHHHRCELQYLRIHALSGPPLTLSRVQTWLKRFRIVAEIFPNLPEIMCSYHSNSLWNIPLCVLCYKGWIMRWQFRIISQFVFPFQILEVLRFNKLFQLFFIKHQINNGWKPLWTWISWS